LWLFLSGLAEWSASAFSAVPDADCDALRRVLCPAGTLLDHAARAPGLQFSNGSPTTARAGVFPRL